MKRILTLLFSILVLLSICSCNKLEYEGKTIILHSNDTHGAIEGFASIATCKKDFESKGAKVILVDDGDFSQGELYVSASKGLAAADLLEKVGYDLITIGNHEFDYGFDKLVSNLSNRSYKVLCSNLKKDGNLVFKSGTVIDTGEVKIGFFGLLTPETQTKTTPAIVKDLTFEEQDDMFETAQKEILSLNDKADIVICLAHLGVDTESEGCSSTDLYANTDGLDFIIDGHSHTQMEHGENGEPIQSTGTKFENVGVIVIDNKTKKIEQNYLISCEMLEPDKHILDEVHTIINKVDEEYSQIFANSEVDLDGEKEHVRTQETNLGDLITDAMIWYFKDSNEIDVPKENIISLSNGGGIRASISKGGISRKNVFDVLPFGDTVSVVYVTGKELLEVLEASTFDSPSSIGGFPQTSGMIYSVNTVKQFNQGEEYPNSTYFAPASIERVSIRSINNRPFDENKTYAVITNEFCANGGDTYYVFASPFNSGKGFDTGITLDEVVMRYIEEELKGVISKKYEKSQNRIWILVS